MELRDLLIALLPLIVLQYVIAIWALVDLIKRKTVKSLPKIGWGVIIFFISFFGPIAYLVFGRGEE